MEKYTDAMKLEFANNLLRYLDHDGWIEATNSIFDHIGLLDPIDISNNTIYNIALIQAEFINIGKAFRKANQPETNKKVA